MRLKNNILLITFLLSVNCAFAQYAEDALRFSQTQPGATARFKALGNAQTALGGDLSSFSGNPAGLGLFTKSEIGLTADFTNSRLNSQYLNQGTNSEKDKLGFNFLGGVLYNPIKKTKGSDLNSGWLSVNFGAAYNKTNNFNRTLDYGGVNPASSFADYLADLATNNYLGAGNPKSNTNALPEGSLEGMAYNNFLIEYDPAGYFPTTSLNNNQRNINYLTGSQSEFNVGFGANYSNKVYVGASLGITSLTYNADREFLESGANRSYPGQPGQFIGGSYNLSFRSSQITEGSGVNAKLGFIYRPVNNFRVGLNFTTPTWYSINDSYAEALDTRYTGIADPYTNPKEIYDSSYDLRTPYRVNGGLAFIFGQGLITGDVEYVDYTSIHFTSSDRAATDNVNSDIRNRYQEAVNFKLGAEYKLDNVYLRAGYNNSGNPYKNADYSADTFSGGLGYRVNNFYVDLAYTNSTMKFSEQPYVISENYPDYNTTGSGAIASLKDKRTGVFLTIGTRF